ncbi:MAG: HD domain-containing protein [Deltaproteobacteria bacterium]|jgi:putative hydrolase of HD superfamily|nr:HD domain-containing protein [Deltaproteobacteria bacterium]
MDRTADERLADFLYEGLMLKRTPRTGWQFLGRGRESVAEHSYGVVFISYALASRARGRGRAPDMERLLLLALFHDLPEARTGDHNYMNKRYVASYEDRAHADAVKALPFAPELESLYGEWKACETLEARLAHDADQLDMVCELARLAADGCHQAAEWIAFARKRFRTDEGRELCAAAESRDPGAWWFERKDEYWVAPRGPLPSGEGN